jgi:hypothetical protein
VRYFPLHFVIDKKIDKKRTDKTLQFDWLF